jgi:hypothetical protein
MGSTILKTKIFFNAKLLELIFLMKCKMEKTKTMTFLVGLTAFLMFSCVSTEKKDPMTFYRQTDESPVPNALTEKEKKAGWELLFDGKTSQGWREYNGKEFPPFWIIEEGCLTMTTTGSQESQDIITEKKYRNFVLSVDFKLTKGANSGILYQVEEGPKYKFSYETGPEFQIIDHENWPDPLEDAQICGANYAMYAPLVHPYRPIGEWNHALLVVDGNHVTQILNGEIVVQYEKYSDDWERRRNSGKWEDYPDWGKFDEGYIALQNHGTKVWFRNIKIKEF